MAKLGLLFLCLLLGSCSAQTNEEIFYQQYEAAFNASGIPWDETLVFDTQSVEPLSDNLNCPSLPSSFIKTVPNSVHELSPYHIKVMGAVGDSVTAGFGAKAKIIFQAFTEYRGVSWSIGGDSGATTLPNLIKYFNPDVKGFSVKTGKSSSRNAHLNCAVSGEVAADIPHQVRDLINRIKADTSINIDEDWKLITLWIGGNDLCRYCNDKDGKSPANYVKHIKEGLDMLRSEMPRTFVNLVQILDVTKLEPLNGLVCDLIHLFVCSCGTTKKNMDETSQAARDYNTGLEEMVGEYSELSDDFTVVLQPFFKHVDLPEDPKSYFGLDCFHFNAKGHADVARTLWNNMMEPVGSKYDHIDWGAKPVFKCPTSDYPYFFTHKNSLSVSSFGAVNPDPSTTDNTSPTNLLAVLLGTGVAVYIVTMTIIIAVIGVVYARRRQRQQALSSTSGISVGMSVDTEKTRLFFKE